MIIILRPTPSISDGDNYSGAFLSGLLVPHDNGFAMAVHGRVDDIVSNIFLPIVSEFFERAFFLSVTSSLFSISLYQV